MPWYYAGPDATPLGPISIEELHARRLQGVVTPETFIIEHTGGARDVLAWRRYREIFPATASTPTVPSTPPPSPAYVPPTSPTSVFAPGTRPDPYYEQFKPTNGWCAWGFGLGLAGLLSSFFCGIGLLLALPSLLLSIVGLAQVSKTKTHSGKGLAVAGLVLSACGLLISLGLIAYFTIPMIKAHQQTVTEQTSNDSE